MHSGLTAGLTAGAMRASRAVLTRRQALSAARQARALLNIGAAPNDGTAALAGTTGTFSGAVTGATFNCRKPGKVQYMTGNAGWDGSSFVLCSGAFSLSLAGITGDFHFTGFAAGDTTITNSPGAAMDGTVLAGSAFMVFCNAAQDDGALASFSVII